MPGSQDTCWSLCGDGRVVGTEACDDGNGNNALGTPTDGCVNCAIVTGWQCAYGTPYHKSLCTEICGDGNDYFHYPCDDGNSKAGDGCSKYCQIERGYTCGGGSNTPAKADTCQEICGDGI